jgi:hypothetical protein
VYKNGRSVLPDFKAAIGYYLLIFAGGNSIPFCEETGICHNNIHYCYKL